MKIKPKLTEEQIKKFNKEQSERVYEERQHALWLKEQVTFARQEEGYKFLDFPNQRATVCYRIADHNVIKFSIALLNPNDKWNKNEGRYQAWCKANHHESAHIKVKNNHPGWIKAIFKSFLSDATGKYDMELR